MNTRTAQTGNTDPLDAQAHGKPAPASDAARGAISAWAMVGLLAGPFLSMVDSSIVNVALPDIAQQVQSPLATAQWITSGYLPALAVVLPATAFLAKRFGTRRVYLVSLAGFTLASTACAMAPSIAWLIGARVVQGALGAPLVPLAMNLLLGRRGKARQLPAAAGMLLFLAPALGPSAGGLLIHVAGWPLIFLVNAPFGLLGILGLLRSGTAAEDDGDGTARFDPIGLVMLAAGFGLAISAASLVALQLTAPAWEIAVLLSGRGLALGLTIQPLLLGLIGTLSAAELADGNTLFNVVERLSGSVGIALLATFFQAREQLQVGAVLQRVGVSPGAIGSAARDPGAATGLASALTPALREQLAPAALP